LGAVCCSREETNLTTTSSTKPRAKANGKGTTLEFHTLTLLLPPDAPGDLAFSIENNEASAAVQEIFGDTQYVAIREQLRSEKLTLKQTFEALRELLNACFAEWDLDAGE
jgi:hypothetical protein